MPPCSKARSTDEGIFRLWHKHRRHLAGVSGAVIGQALVGWVMHLAVIGLARKHRMWDPLHDLVFAVPKVLASGLVLYIHPPS